MKAVYIGVNVDNKITTGKIYDVSQHTIEIDPIYVHTYKYKDDSDIGRFELKSLFVPLNKSRLEKIESIMKSNNGIKK